MPNLEIECLPDPALEIKRQPNGEYAVPLQVRGDEFCPWRNPKPSEYDEFDALGIAARAPAPRKARKARKPAAVVLAPVLAVAPVAPVLRRAFKLAAFMLSARLNWLARSHAAHGV